MNRNVAKLFIAFALAASAWVGLIQTLGAHSYRIPLLVDTDMALDDMRALILLINQDLADIRLITTADGALAPEKGLRSLRLLLTRLGKANIPLASGRALNQPAPAWREWTEKILGENPAGGAQGKSSPPRAAQAIAETLHNQRSQAMYLALGPLTNLADALNREPAIKEKISRIIFMGSIPGKVKIAWNTERDINAIEKVIGTGLPIYFINTSFGKELNFDNEFFRKIKGLNTPASECLINLHQTPEAKKRLEAGHFKIWDELAVLYLGRPDLFRLVQKGNTSFLLSDFSPDKVREAYLQSLGYAADLHLEDRKTVVLRAIPVDPSLFQEDIRPFVEKIIHRFGLEEWKATVLTNEFHRHLGTYSIIGAKMGIRAREILGAPFDTLTVISQAGNAPPLSCLNDGLQMSTGASLGRGGIKMNAEGTSPSAIFSFDRRRITLTLKEEIVRKIEADIGQAIRMFGNLTPAYFNQVRKASIRYWLELDRARIFNEQE